MQQVSYAVLYVARVTAATMMPAGATQATPISTQRCSVPSKGVSV